MRLDGGGMGGAAGFDRIRINGALAENPVVVHQSAGLDNAFLHPHKLFADDMALQFGFADRFERFEKFPFAMRNIDHPGPKRSESAFDEFGFALAHEPGVDVNAAHPRGSQRPQAERKGHGRIDAAAHKEEHIAVADALPDLILDERDTLPRIPVFLAAANVEHKVFKYAGALGCV